MKVLENAFKMVYRGPESALRSLGAGKQRNQRIWPEFGLPPAITALKQCPHVGRHTKGAVLAPLNLRQPFLDPEFAVETSWRVRFVTRGRRYGDTTHQCKRRSKSAWSWYNGMVQSNYSAIDMVIR